VEVDKEDTGSVTLKSGSTALGIVIVVVALFAGVIAAKTLGPAAAPGTAQSEVAAPGAQPPAGVAITSAQNDAFADYDAALQTGRPVFVLFHSLTCKPCVEISAVVDKVMPEYEDKVEFVNAISDDESAKRLAAKFKFQYIPSSFFLTSEGEVADSFTGSMSEDDLRARLDTLIAQ